MTKIQNSKLYDLILKSLTRYRFVFFLLLLFLIPISLNCSKNELTEKKSSEETKGVNGKEEMAVKIFFLNGSQLAYEERTISFDRWKPSKKISSALEELIKGPKKEPLKPTLPKKTKLINVFIDEEGVTYINFSKDIIINHPGGTFGELITIYSIIRTLTENFEEVQAVQILIGGKEINPLIGHIDTSMPFKLKSFSETSLNQ